ncbi:MAG TPA: hypothetical protein DCS93_04375 [Microscillaceae bacterium]|nr:hypothetical protein [Microscillaceae bacterium]
MLTTFWLQPVKNEAPPLPTFADVINVSLKHSAMSKLQIITVAFILGGLLATHSSVNAQSQKQTKDMEHIQNLINTIVGAADSRNTTTLEKHLHPEFRVVANRFGGDDAKVLPKKIYLDLIKAGKIGGDKRSIAIQSIDVKDHIAVAKATLTGSKAVFTSFYQFVKNAQNEWQLINDMPLVSAKK